MWTAISTRKSLEEAAEGFCTRVEIMLLQDGRVRIRDNGRGLPLSEDIQADRMVLNKILADGEFPVWKACRLWYTGTAEASGRIM